MALFFDSEWFDVRLARVHLSRGDLARALGLSDAALAEIWKDQRELSARDVAMMAALLNVPAEDVANHAGISTPVPRGESETLAGISARLERVERALEELKTLLLNRNG